MDTFPGSYNKETPGFWHRKSSLPVIPLAMLTTALILIYVIPNWPAHWGYYLSPLLFVVPFFVTLLISIFGVLYTYKAIRGSVQVWAQVIAWLFIAVAIFAFLYIVSAGSTACIGFFSSTVPCTSSRILIVFGVLLSPVGAVFLDILAVTGIAILFLKPKS